MKNYKELSRREFNKECEKFDNAKGMDIYQMCKNSYEPLLSEVIKEKFDTLLDVGCGTGNAIEKLLVDFPRGKYTGIDLAENMIEVASKKKLPQTEFMVGDAESLPFDDNKFDVIICKESFHHYPNVEQFFKSAYRVLKPKGRLIILDMNIPAVGRLLYNNIIFKLMNTGDVHVYGFKEIEKLYNESNFKVEKIDKVGNMRFLSVGRKK